MMATLPGLRLYAERGYVAGVQIDLEVGPGIMLQLVPMIKPAA